MVGSENVKDILISYDNLLCSILQSNILSQLMLWLLIVIYKKRQMNEMKAVDGKKIINQIKSIKM
jgi:hypothetical protein